MTGAPPACGSGLTDVAPAASASLEPPPAGSQSTITNKKTRMDSHERMRLKDSPSGCLAVAPSQPTAAAALCDSANKNKNCWNTVERSDSMQHCIATAMTLNIYILL